MDSSDTIRIGGFEISHLYVSFIVLGILGLIFYCLWTWPCGNDSSGHSSEHASCCLSEGRVISRSDSMRSSKTEMPTNGILMYAMELEPGTVILQSQDGELFRILREFDSLANYGTSTHGLPPGTVSPVHYMPSYTRAHLQTRPSAPPLFPCDERSRGPTVEQWQPLHLQNGVSY